jgi:VAD1 Analog of StAR-related lipid transfer domain
MLNLAQLSHWPFSITVNAWSKHNELIGTAKLPDGVKEEDFIGAERECSYLMPKSAFVAANMAFETTFVEAYNDFCFSFKKKALTPNVPYGSTFEAWTKYVVINTGKNSCKMICSVQAEFPNGPPMISRQIKSGMRTGVGELFMKTGETIQKYANAYP